MPLIAHAAWGALFIRFFGFSYETLRASTLNFMLFGVVAAYAPFDKCITIGSLLYSWR